MTKAALKILLGLLATVLVGVASIHFDILPGSAISAELGLQKRADQQLADGDFSWAKVTIDGQKAVIAGAAPSEEDFDNALAAVTASAWRGGVIVGGVTAVDHTGVPEVEILPVADPYLLIVERLEDAVIISGNAPSENARREVIKIARDRFRGAEISGGLEIAAGAPPESDWLIAVSTSLAALARLDDGAVEAIGVKFTLSGAANSDERADVLRGLMSSMPDGFSGVANINVIAPEPAPDATLVARTSTEEAPLDDATAGASDAAPDTAPSTVSNTVSDDDCRNQLRQKIDDHQVSFSLASATITGASRTHLAGLAVIIRACPQFAVEISGHTDTTGGEFSNRRLSQRRADAVAAYLVENGVSAPRLSARGVGSAEPLADNRTRDGRQRNRRIDMDLIFDPQ